MNFELLIAQAQSGNPEELTTWETIAGGLCCMAPFILLAILGVVILAILAFAFGWLTFLIKWMNDMRKK